MRGHIVFPRQNGDVYSQPNADTGYRIHDHTKEQAVQHLPHLLSLGAEDQACLVSYQNILRGIYAISIVDGILVTLLVIFVVVVVAGVSLARRRRRSVAASRSYDQYIADDDNDDCVELGEFATELEDSWLDGSITASNGTTSPTDWGIDDSEELQADTSSLTPLCGRSTSSAASSVTGGSTPSDAPLF